MAKGEDLSLAEVKDIFEYTSTDEELTEERMYNLEEFGYDKNIPGMMSLHLTMKSVYT